MGRSPCSSSSDGLKKGPWSSEEDQMLIDYVNKHGHGSWKALPKRAGLNRCGKSCRLRWTNYLRPDIKRGSFSDEEEKAIINFHSVLGNKWSRIASHLPGRTDNEIKNYWNTHLRKKLIKSGIDPKTHTPIHNFGVLSNPSQLQSISSMLNLFNPLEIIALSLQANAAQIAKNQLIRNILQATMNTNPFPNFPETSISLPASQNLDVLDGLNSAKIQIHPMNSFQEVSDIPGLSNINQLFHEYPASNSSSRIVEGDINPDEIIRGFINSSKCNSDTGYVLPPLVAATSASPSSSNKKAIDSIRGMCIPTDTYDSSIFDDLEKILDSDDNSFPWSTDTTS